MHMQCTGAVQQQRERHNAAAEQRLRCPTLEVYQKLTLHSTKVTAHLLSHHLAGQSLLRARIKLT
jgi:hypothetical protein